MRSKEGQVADWRDEAAYAPLLAADRSLFAWEWLRRDPAFRDAATRSRSRPVAAGPAARVSDQAAARWGLHAFEPPCLSAGKARPLWRREVFPAILCVRARDEGEHGERLDLGRLERFVTILKGPTGTEHLLLSDGWRTLRLDIMSGTVTAGPVLLDYQLCGMKRALGPLLALRQLLALWRGGQFSRSLHPPEARAARWILVLRARDALAAGANQKEIAAGLLDGAAAGPRWRVEAPDVRSRVQRLVRTARKMAAGGYLSLLGGR